MIAGVRRPKKLRQMPNYEFIGKSQLSRGFSFPLKRSTLDAFLDERGISAVTGVAYCDPSDDHQVLCADYHGPRKRGMSHTLNLWVNAVPSAIRQDVAHRIENELLSTLSNWIIQFADRSKSVSQSDHRFEIHYDDVTDDGVCRLDVRVDVPRKQWRLPRFRAKVRP